MEYGITVPRAGIAEHPSPWKYLGNFARESDQMGCAYGVIGDRLESGMDSFSVLTAIAEASGRMRLATSVLVLPPRGILVAAKQYTALDVLTGGRVIAGVGTGSMFRDYEVVGMAHNDMWPRFEEGVRALRAYLTPGAPPFTGRFYDTNGVTLEPHPVQRPGLPIWIGSWGSNAGLRRVARLADGWLSSAGPGHQSPEQFAEDVKRLNTFLVQEGKDPATFPSAVSTMGLFISEDQDELARIGGPGYAPMKTLMPTTWSAPVPHALTRCAGGRPLGFRRSFSSPVEPTPWGKCVSL
jgi:alkanesulfonate monooxygenase SsuD/methylene tetrahydromethanopterin reductase-like flavin-dependent oxidoreductase (luciferase family)